MSNHTHYNEALRDVAKGSTKAGITAEFELSTLLFVIFLVLKLAGVIAWSWWWVTAPLWLPIVTVIGLALFLAGVAGIVWLAALWFDS
jgi:hypothetical protein